MCGFDTLTLGPRVVVHHPWVPFFLRIPLSVLICGARRSGVPSDVGKDHVPSPVGQAITVYFPDECILGLYPFFGKGSPTKKDYMKKRSWHPYSNLSTGGPSISIAKVGTCVKETNWLERIQRA